MINEASWKYYNRIFYSGGTTLRFFLHCIVPIIWEKFKNVYKRMKWVNWLNIQEWQTVTFSWNAIHLSYQTYDLYPVWLPIIENSNISGASLTKTMKFIIRKDYQWWISGIVELIKSEISISSNEFISFIHIAIVFAGNTNIFAEIN